MEEERRLPGWILPLVAVLGVVALVVVALNREPARFDPDTPEGTVQLYLNAVVAGDWDSASSLWAAHGCLPVSNVPVSSTNVAAVLLDVDANDREGTVRVRLSGSSEDSVGGIYEHEQWFDLVREDGRWRIQQPSWPHHDQSCEKAR